jgi:hypothetical protein
MEEKIIEAIYNVYCEIGYLISESEEKGFVFYPHKYNKRGEIRPQKGMLAKIERARKKRQGDSPVKDPVTGEVYGPKDEIPGPKPTSYQARSGSKA